MAIQIRDGRSTALGRLMGLGTLAFGLLVLLVFNQPLCEAGDGILEADLKSDYSRMRIRKDGNVRTLWFVRDSGEEVIESQVDLKKPHDLIVSYTKYMFLSYAFRPNPEKVLIVGLGGGSMIHFLKHYDPKVKVDVVEIDPVIVSVADKYFGVKSGGNINIVTQDAFDFLKNTKEKYDVVYMDAFLKPSPATIETGTPKNLMTIQFYKDIQKKLNPDGLVVYNLNPHKGIQQDVKNISAAFPQTYIFPLPYDGGLVVVGSLSPKRLSMETVRKNSEGLDSRFKTSYSFKQMASMLVR